jgi:hypothetical protein
MGLKSYMDLCRGSPAISCTLSLGRVALTLEQIEVRNKNLFSVNNEGRDIETSDDTLTTADPLRKDHKAPNTVSVFLQIIVRPHGVQY